MAGIGGLLTQKLGPFPGWVWALGVGGVIFFLGPKLVGKSSGATATAGPGGFDPQSFAAGFSQGAAQYQGTTPDRTNPSSPPGPIGTQPIDPTSRSAPPQSPRHPWRTLSQAPGVGGFTRNRSASIGSLSADPHAYWHPAMKQQPRYAHFVRAGVGGAPVAHAEAVHQLAHQAEIHPARLQMLNNRPHRLVRVA
jgi:hypothetical protein